MVSDKLDKPGTNVLFITWKIVNIVLMPIPKLHMRTRILNTFIIIVLSFFAVTSCSNSGDTIVAEGMAILLDEENTPIPDHTIDSIITTYREPLKDEMNRVLVYSEEVLQKGTPEGKLNNFVADLVFEKGQEYYEHDNKPIDFCLLNYGGLRVPLPRGAITYGRVYELLPFENEMVVITLTGEKTFELFEYLARAERGMPVSGIELTLKDQAPHQIKIQNEYFDMNKTYKILTSDYLANGGDDMTFFEDPLNYEFLDMRVRDAIIEFMLEKGEKNEKISAKLDGRISVIN
ncbi:MAG: 5'-nucleotidase C-terminal domain-containing protein [Bacteroidota bacterium]